MTKRKKGLMALVSALVVCLVGVGVTEAASSENIIVHFHGNIGPQKRPRVGVTPVSVQLGGKITTKDGSPPPRLSEILLEINKGGQIETKGLPVCRLGELNNASDARAKRVCGPAEVGHGNVTSRIKLPEQEEFSTNGNLSAFNGRYKGAPAIFAHVSSHGKLSITYVIVFQIKKSGGKFGTALIAKVPEIASGAGHISAFDLTLQRKYSAGGKKKSYVSAGCPLPKGVPIATFPFSKASYAFEDGTKISETLSKTCRARG